MGLSLLRVCLNFILFRTLHQGIHDLRVWPGEIANGSNSTPGKASKGSADEMSKLAKVNTLFKPSYETFMCEVTVFTHHWLYGT